MKDVNECGPVAENIKKYEEKKEKEYKNHR